MYKNTRCCSSVDIHFIWKITTASANTRNDTMKKEEQKKLCTFLAPTESEHCEQNIKLS